MAEAATATSAFDLSTNSLETHRICSLPHSFYYIPNFISLDEEAHLLSKINDPKAKWQNLAHRRLQVYPSALTKSNVLLLSERPSSNGATLPSWLTDAIQPKFDALRLFDLPSSATATSSVNEHGNGNQKTSTTASTTSPSPPTPPNHCLINEYPPGRGIMPHEDGAAYLPIVATVSLGSHTVLDLYAKRGPESETEADEPDAAGAQSPENHNDDTAEHDQNAKRKTRSNEPIYRVLQEPRSLLVTTERAYTDFLHGIADVSVDEGLRPVEGEPEDGRYRGEGGKETGIANWEQLGDPASFPSGATERETRVSLTFRRVVKVKDVSRSLGGLLGRPVGGVVGGKK